MRRSVASISGMFGSTSIAASTLSVTPHGLPATHSTRSTVERLAAVARRRAARRCRPVPCSGRARPPGSARVRGWLGPSSAAGRPADARREGRMEVRADRAEHAAVGLRRQHVDVRQQRPPVAGSRRVEVRVDAGPGQVAVAEVPGHGEEPLRAAVLPLGAGLGHAPDAEADPGRRERGRRAVGEDRAGRVPSLGLATATAAADGPGEASGAGCGPSAPAATIPTSSTPAPPAPTRRSVRRAGDRGLVGTGSTIIGCQWYVPGRRPDDRRAPLLCTDGADRGARGRHRAELLAGDDADAAGPARRDAPATRPTSWSSAAGSRACRRPAARRSSARASSCSRPSAWAGAPRRATAG